MDVHELPAVNATLNAIAGIFLLFGWKAIKSGNRKFHQTMMVCALCASTLFLISYITYHVMAGVTHYQGQGVSKLIYFFILLTHTPLAVIIVPFSLMALWFALKGKFDQHVNITRWLWPVWMYVSCTGVLIYLMLYVFY